MILNEEIEKKNLQVKTGTIGIKDLYPVKLR